MVADMIDRAQVKGLAAEAVKRLGKIDILVNNAGSNMPQAIDEITDEAWDRIVELDLTSCMALTRYLVPAMKERKWGRVIHISSVLGVGSKEKRNVYSACKAGLIGLAKASAIDLGTYNITVNCLCPGPFLTDLPGDPAEAPRKSRPSPTAPPSSAGASPRSLPVPPYCCSPARPAAISRARPLLWMVGRLRGRCRRPLSSLLHRSRFSRPRSPARLDQWRTA